MRARRLVSVLLTRDRLEVSIKPETAVATLLDWVDRNRLHDETGLVVAR